MPRWGAAGARADLAEAQELGALPRNTHGTDRMTVRLLERGFLSPSRQHKLFDTELRSDRPKQVPLDPRRCLRSQTTVVPVLEQEPQSIAARRVKREQFLLHSLWKQVTMKEQTKKKRDTACSKRSIVRYQQETTRTTYYVILLLLSY